jgi:hypothetical protein
VGATRKGKTLAAARSIVEAPHDAAVILDPHKLSLAYTVLTHASDNILFERLSDIQYTLGFEFLTPSSNPDPRLRQQENHRRAEAFVAILLRRRGDDGMANTPLMEEWVMGAIMLYLCQAVCKPLTLLPFAFMPASPEFAALLKDCTLPEVRHKFQQLERLTPRSARRSWFGHPAHRQRLSVTGVRGSLSGRFRPRSLPAGAWQVDRRAR